MPSARVASQESEESTQMGAQAAGPTASSQDLQLQPEPQRQLAETAANQKTINGHHDPRQRLIYQQLLCASCASALLGFLLVLVWMYKYRSVTGLGLTNAGQLANLHPVLMFLFMVSLNMYALLVYRTHYARPKEQLKWSHAIVTGLNMVMSLLGVLAMFKAHLMMDMANFYSLHSWFGALTNIFFVCQFSLGFISFLRPGLAQHRRAALMPYHRRLGILILVLAGLSAITGIAELVIFQDSGKAYSSFTPITFIANGAGLCVLITTAISVTLLTAPQYQRPALAEELPLKR